MEQNILVGYIYSGIIFGLICAFACYQIMKAKGYPDYACGRGLGWAYLLNIIWVIVTLCRPQAKSAGKIQEENDMSLWEFLILFVLGIALIVTSFLVSGEDGSKMLGISILFFSFAPLMALFGRI